MSRFEVIHGVEGCCLVLDDTRIAGPKPWGGGTVLYDWETDKEYRAVDNAMADDNAMAEHTCTMRVDSDYFSEELYPCNGLRCSECGEIIWDVNPINYCSNCGSPVTKIIR